MNIFKKIAKKKTEKMRERLITLEEAYVSLEKENEKLKQEIEEYNQRISKLMEITAEERKRYLALIDNLKSIRDEYQKDLNEIRLALKPFKDKLNSINETQGQGSD